MSFQGVQPLGVWCALLHSVDTAGSTICIKSSTVAGTTSAGEGRKPIG